MEYTLLLLGYSAISLALSWMVWLRTRAIGFVVGFFFLYFWSLHGAWSIVADLTGRESGMHYHYLLGKMFGVALDDDYLRALFLYALFIIVVQLVVLATARSKSERMLHDEPISVSHPIIIVACAIAGFVSLWVVRDQLALAAILNLTGYDITAGGHELVENFTVHQVLNRIAMLPLGLGAAVFCCGRDGRFLIGRRSIGNGLGYSVVGLVLVASTMIMGNKNELFAALIGGGILYLSNATHARIGRLVLSGLLGFASLALVDLVRTLSLVELGEGLRWSDASIALGGLFASNEAFASHLSMYGVLHYRLDLTYGSSLLSLLASAIPRAFWPDRPGEIYDVYAQGVGALEGQGYTIHHATAWYLNFGVVGVVLGAVLLGLLWSWSFNLSRRFALQPTSTMRLLSALAFAGLTSGLPNMLRTGPEGYKSLLMYGLAAPMLVFAAASFPYARWIVGRRQWAKASPPSMDDTRAALP